MVVSQLNKPCIPQYILYLKWVEEKASKLHTQQVPPEDIFTLLTFFHFCYRFYSLAFLSYYFQCLLMSILFFICGLAYEIYSGGGPSMYIYCVVYYHVIAAPYVRSIVMSLHYTLREESSQTNVILQYKLLAVVLSAVCSVIQQA